MKSKSKVKKVAKPAAKKIAKPAAKKVAKPAAMIVALPVGNAVVAQSGGPTRVINASLIGVLRMWQLIHGKNMPITALFGARHGIEGILKDDYVDLSKLPKAKWPLVACTPSAALGSCRLKPDAEMCRKIVAAFKKKNVRYFFYIGGNDSADAARIVAEEAEKAGYPLRVYHIPKTIDNDLRSCDHTPGFGSAAKFVVNAFMGDDLDNRALGGVKINVVMGRDAGFLTASSALARQNPGDGPHLIYMPERPFSITDFVKDVKAVMAKEGRCVVAVSEGIRDANGVSIGAKFAGGEKDSHGNVQMSGTGALGDYLARTLKEKTNFKRVRADTFGYLQRSYPDTISDIDVGEALDVGSQAVMFAICPCLDIPAHGTVAIERDIRKKKYTPIYKALPIASAARETRSMPDEFIAANGHDVTKAFLDYARPLVGQINGVVLL